ncbi:hypothetical protein DFR70_108282 [Nocardia tenerifensis]|uniref:Uncharacterized protein n=1 Tax=Nocardia tenerifensis TaxID=228006 RepID=A0A318K2L3_9NOCA|nr:hypothetical protein [Nocardia tenerifensis]PXX61724.1 hypothetical protein DFR70_108282 [Nocardia tenerifensis]
MAPQPNNTVRVDPDALIDKGKKLAELPGAPNGLFEILTKLSGNLQRLGEPWGDDKLGKQFAEGKEGYLSAKDAVVGNGSTGPDASGAVPVYAQLLVNYGRTLEEAGKAFAGGEDLFAEWMLKNYIDEDAKGNQGPYKGPVSSDPNHGKTGENSGNNGPTGPPVPPPGGYQGPGGGPEIKNPSGGETGAGGPGPGVGGMSSGGPGTGGPGAFSGPPVANYSAMGASGPASPFASKSGSLPGDFEGLPRGLGALPGGVDASLNPGLPGVLGPNAYKPIDPITGAPLDKSGAPGVGGKGGGPGGTLPSLRSVSAFDGEKLANKNGQPGSQTRAGVPGSGMMPGTPGGMPPGGQGGAPGDGKEKRRERRRPSPQVDEQVETSEVGNPWQRSGWRTGDR